MNNVIVVGSGPAGISVATGLLERGCKVTLLDAGNTLEIEKQNVLHEIQKNNLDLSFLKSTAYAKKKLKLPYGSNFIYDDVKDYFSWKTQNCYLPHSFAQGGLSNAWGGVLSEFSEKELSNWPESCRNLSTYYPKIISLFEKYYTSDSSNFLSTQACYLKDRWSKNRSHLENDGFYFRPATLGVNFNHCRLCGSCQHGCPYELIYHTSIYLALLKLNKNFDYVNGVVVENFFENNKDIEILVKHIKDKRSFRMKTDRLFIASGSGLSSLLYLRSLNEIGKKLVLKDSQHFILPCLLDKRFKNVKDDNLHTLCQLEMSLTQENISRYPIHLQFYTYMDLYKIELKNKLKWSYFLLKPLLKSLVERLIIIQGYLDSRESNYLTIQYKCNNQFEIKANKSRSVMHTINCISRYLKQNKNNLAFNPLLFLSSKSLVGQANHVGGSLPMSDDPKGDEVNIWGTPNHFKRVHFVDGSILPSIPAGPITLTIMANAYRIGKEAPL